MACEAGEEKHANYASLVPNTCHRWNQCSYQWIDGANGLLYELGCPIRDDWRALVNEVLIPID